MWCRKPHLNAALTHCILVTKWPLSWKHLENPLNWCCSFGKNGGGLEQNLCQGWSVPMVERFTLSINSGVHWLDQIALGNLPLGLPLPLTTVKGGIFSHIFRLSLTSCWHSGTQSDTTPLWTHRDSNSSWLYPMVKKKKNIWSFLFVCGSWYWQNSDTLARPITSPASPHAANFIFVVHFYFQVYFFCCTHPSCHG